MNHQIMADVIFKIGRTETFGSQCLVHQCVQRHRLAIAPQCPQPFGRRGRRRIFAYVNAQLLGLLREHQTQIDLLLNLRGRHGGIIRPATRVKPIGQIKILLGTQILFGGNLLAIDRAQAGPATAGTHPRRAGPPEHK